LFWVLFGCFADYSFPYGQALELLLACFKGTVSAKVNSLQQQIQRIEPTFRRSLSKVDNIGDKLAQGSEESIFVHH
jgi:hypothetical protein